MGRKSQFSEAEMINAIREVEGGAKAGDRFDQAWALIAATFHADVTILANVIALKPQRAPRRKRARTSR